MRPRSLRLGPAPLAAWITLLELLDIGPISRSPSLASMHSGAARLATKPRASRPAAASCLHSAGVRVPDLTEDRSLRAAIKRHSDPEQWAEFERYAREAPSGTITFRSVWVEGDEARRANFRAQLQLRMRRLYEQAQRHLVSVFHEKLVSGELIGVGMFVRPKVSSEPEIISRHLWSGLSPKFEDSSAQSDDIRVVGIRIYTREEIELLRAAESQVSTGPSTDPYKTGLPGRQTIRHLILAEFERLAASGQMEQTIAGQARSLRAWAAATHPGAPTPSVGTIENHIREAYNAAKTRTTKSPTQ